MSFSNQQQTILCLKCLLAMRVIVLKSISNTKNMKRFFIPLFLIVGLVLCISCKEQNGPKQAHTYRVKIAKVHNASKNEVTELSGVVKEAKAVNLAFRVAGPIQKLNVSEGSYVGKGDVIAQMDTRDYELQLSAAQAEYNKVIDEVTRVKELYNRKSVSEADYQKAIAGEQMITAKLNRAKDQLNDTKLCAPFSGYIQKVNYQQGEIVNTGMSVASLINVDYYNVEIDIPAALFVQRNKFVSVKCKSSLEQDKTIPMNLVSSDVVANSSRLFRMVYRLNPKADKFIAPGMEVKVIIEYIPETDNRIVVPIESVFSSNGTSKLWVYNEADSTVNSREVVTNEIIGNGNIIISEGLTGTETIVTAGVNSLKEGAKVQVIQPKSKTNIGGLL